MSFAKTVKFC